jgi:hypothetical protein
VHRGCLKKLPKRFYVEEIQIGEVYDSVVSIMSLLNQHKILSADEDIQHVCELEPTPGATVRMFKSVARRSLL